MSGACAEEGTTRLVPFEGRHAELYDDLIGPAPDEVGNYLRLARGSGSILELGCGTGRILLPLVSAGFQVTGIDRSKDMIGLLERKSESLEPEARSRIATIAGDIRDFSLEARFDLILFPCCSLLLFPDAADRLAIFDCVRRHLAPGGRFAFDYRPLQAAQARRMFGRPFLRSFPTRAGQASIEVVARMRPDEAGLDTDIGWTLSNDGADEKFVETKPCAFLDRDLIEGELGRAGLRMVSHSDAPGLEGAETVTMVECARSDETGPLWLPYAPRLAGPEPAPIVSGEGTELRDSEGRAFLDACGGLWNLPLGLGQEEIVAAAEEQMRRLAYSSLFQGRAHEPALRLSEELSGLAPAGLSNVFLTGSGSESIELAIKLARQNARMAGARGRSGIAYLDNSYHGTFFGSASVSGLLDDQWQYGPVVPHSVRLPSPVSAAGTPPDLKACISALERAADEAPPLAALIVEPVLGSAGVLPLPNAYVEAVNHICAERGILVIADEVATGLGRAGAWFASEAVGLKADILLLSKGLAAGYLPIGAVLFGRRVADALVASGSAIPHGSTQNGNPVCCAAASAALRILRRLDAPRLAREQGAALKHRLEGLLTAPCVEGVRSVGMMLAIDLRQRSGAACTPRQIAILVRLLETRGLLVYPSDSCLVLMPALTLGSEDAERIATIAGDLLGEVQLSGDSVRHGSETYR